MKRILALILALIIFALALTGCKKPEKTDDTSSNESKTNVSENVDNDSSKFDVITSDATTSKSTHNTVSNNPTQSASTTTPSNQQTTVTSEQVISIAPPPSEKLVMNKEVIGQDDAYAGMIKSVKAIVY